MQENEKLVIITDPTPELVFQPRKTLKNKSILSITLDKPTQTM
jgi:hypothetical protein